MSTNYIEKKREKEERRKEIYMKLDAPLKRRGLKRKASPVVYFCALFAYLEIAFHLLMFGSLEPSIIYPIIGGLAVGCIVGTLCRLAPSRVNWFIIGGATCFFCVLFGSEIVYYSVFSTYYLLFGIGGVAGQAWDFLGIIFQTMWQNLGKLVFIAVIPIYFAAGPLPRVIDIRRKRFIRYHVYALVAAVALFLLVRWEVALDSEGVYSALELYTESLSVDPSIEKLGVLNTTLLSGRNKLTGREDTYVIYDDTADSQDDVPTEDEVYDDDTDVADGSDVEENTEEEVEEEEVIDTSPNILDIDFDQIIEESGNNSDVVSLCEYMEGKSGTNKNEYTGLFEGYNIIWITAEGLDGRVISEDLMPTLYKMANEGFVFNNYYSPLWYGSTSGGEWANLTGTVPKNGSYVSMPESGRRGLDMLFTAGRQASRLGYLTVGWHNNSYTYYDRNLSFPNMGYTWYGTGQGYEPELGSSGKALWPQSDVNLIDQSFPTYSDSEPFLVYYMTVSGHMNYSWTGNAMSARNRDKVEDLDYSETTKAYIAANLELEYAMEDLLQDLEDSGLADHTVIILAPDHVPYDDMDVVNDLAGEDLDEIESYRNTLIIYSEAMEEPVQVDKYCCSVDILPTVSNLMGWDYDSRMMVGEDILSDSEQFVMFPGLSYITDKIIYNASTGAVTSLTGEEVDNDYISSMQSKAKNWYTISDLLFSTDFYQYVEDQMPEAEVITATNAETTEATDTGTAEVEDATTEAVDGEVLEENTGGTTE